MKDTRIQVEEGEEEGRRRRRGGGVGREGVGRGGGEEEGEEVERGSEKKERVVYLTSRVSVEANHTSEVLKSLLDSIHPDYLTG